MSASLDVPGLARLKADVAAARAAVEDPTDTHGAVASLVGRVAVTTAPRGRTGQTAGSVRFGATTHGAEVTVGARNAVPTHWGAPAINQRGNPWVARAWSTSEPDVVDLYERKLDDALAIID